MITRDMLSCQWRDLPDLTPSWLDNKGFIITTASHPAQPRCFIISNPQDQDLGTEKLQSSIHHKLTLPIKYHDTKPNYYYIMFLVRKCWTILLYPSCWITPVSAESILLQLIFPIKPNHEYIKSYQQKQYDLQKICILYTHNYIIPMLVMAQSISPWLIREFYELTITCKLYYNLSRFTSVLK